MAYVIRRSGDNAFVAAPGTLSSYVSRLQDAKRFESEDAARAERCGNEYIQSVDDAFVTPTAGRAQQWH